MRTQKLGIIFLLLITSSACEDLRRYTVYDDTKSAEADGVYKRGWLPQWVPADAINIHEHHDLDTNDQAISFELVIGNKLELPGDCAIATNPKPPRIRTKLFPQSIHELSGVQNCQNLYVVVDTDALVHVWGNRIYP